MCIHRYIYVCTAFVCMQHFPDPASAWSQPPVGKYKYSNYVPHLYQQSTATYEIHVVLTTRPPPPKKNIVDPKLG